MTGIYGGHRLYLNVGTNDVWIANPTISNVGSIDVHHMQLGWQNYWTMVCVIQILGFCFNLIGFYIGFPNQIDFFVPAPGPHDDWLISLTKISSQIFCFRGLWLWDSLVWNILILIKEVESWVWYLILNVVWDHMPVLTTKLQIYGIRMWPWQ